MAVLNVLSITLDVPDLGRGIAFYSDAGLSADVDGEVARFQCPGQGRDSVVLVGGALRKRLRHISLRADDLDGMATHIEEFGGTVVGKTPESAHRTLWVRDPHGMLIQLVDRPADRSLEPVSRFEINAPGHLVRKGRSAIRPATHYGPVKPLRLGHVLLFTPDVMASVRFMTEALGMGLADHSQDIIAFCCARKESDHHVVAFAKSAGVGFHHVSFQVSDPDEVGRAGRELLGKSGRGDWGFGRHTIGSNFFHYIQDPWGSWLEYYSDLDYIEDYSQWIPSNYDLKDSLASWGPSVPPDFIHNYEADQAPTFGGSGSGGRADLGGTRSTKP